MTEKKNFIMYRLILFGLILGLVFNLSIESSEAADQRSSPILNEYAHAMINDGNEPPKNPFLADSPWPMSHRNPYQQASSPYPGPSKMMPKEHFTFVQGLPGVITIAFSGKYSDGSRVDVESFKKRVQELAKGPKDKEAVKAKLKELSQQGITKKEMNPDELINMKEEILERVQRRAEAYEQVSQSCAKSAALAVIEEFGLGDISVIKALSGFPGIALTGETCGLPPGIGARIAARIIIEDMEKRR